MADSPRAAAPATESEPAVDPSIASSDPAKASVRGVVFLARVPPFMKPAKVRHLLEAVGPVDRIFLVPEGDDVRKRRARAGGNKKVRFTEGWVEFLRRADAKRAVEMLHNRPVAASGRGFHGSDLWGLKFLRRFQWHHLEEKLRYEEQLRTARLKSGLAEARRENEAYLRRAEEAGALAAVERKKRTRAGAEGGEASREAAEADIRAKRLRAGRNKTQTAPLSRELGPKDAE